MRRPLVAGNWKMHKTVAQARAFAAQFSAFAWSPDVDVAIAPPFTALAALGEAFAGTRIALGAQTMHEGECGAFTGEIAAPMLVELGVRYVILGHSERRAHCGETDAGVHRKVRAALAHGLIPIVAVGETHAEHVAGRTRAKVVAQTRAAFEGLAVDDVAGCVVAYEPIWAIGTGSNDDPPNANAVIGDIRASVAGLGRARLLYGGSMKGANAAAFLACDQIDGGLIGGASLDPQAFFDIVEAAGVRAAGFARGAR